MSTSSKAWRRFGAAAAVALLLSGCGLTAPRGSEGFADLESPGLFDTDRVMSLSLGPAVLGFAADHVDDDPETQRLLRSLEGVRIRIYEVDGDADRVAERLEQIAGRLKAAGWESAMTVREADEQVDVLLRQVNGRIHGMTVLVLDGGAEVVLVNLMGDIRPDQFGPAMAAMDVDVPAADRVNAAAEPGG